MPQRRCASVLKRARVGADAVVLIEGVYSTSDLLRGYLNYTIWIERP